MVSHAPYTHSTSWLIVMLTNRPNSTTVLLNQTFKLHRHLRRSFASVVLQLQTLLYINKERKINKAHPCLRIGYIILHEIGARFSFVNENIHLEIWSIILHLKLKLLNTHSNSSIKQTTFRIQVLGIKSAWPVFNVTGVKWSKVTYNGRKCVLSC